MTFGLQWIFSWLTVHLDVKASIYKARTMHFFLGGDGKVTNHWFTRPYPSVSPPRAEVLTLGSPYVRWQM